MGCQQSSGRPQPRGPSRKLLSKGLPGMVVSPLCLAACKKLAGNGDLSLNTARSQESSFMAAKSKESSSFFSTFLNRMQRPLSYHQGPEPDPHPDEHLSGVKLRRQGRVSKCPGPAIPEGQTLPSRTFLPCGGGGRTGGGAQLGTGGE